MQYMIIQEAGKSIWYPMWRETDLQEWQHFTAEDKEVSCQSVEEAEQFIESQKQTFWNKEFPITSVTREDLVSHGFSEAVVKKLTDHDMQEIASAMEDVYCDHGYWEDLELCTKRVLERLGEESEVEEDDDG